MNIRKEAKAATARKHANAETLDEQVKALAYQVRRKVGFRLWPLDITDLLVERGVINVNSRRFVLSRRGNVLDGHNDTTTLSHLLPIGDTGDYFKQKAIKIYRAILGKGADNGETKGALSLPEGGELTIVEEPAAPFDVAPIGWKMGDPWPIPEKEKEVEEG